MKLSQLLIPLSDKQPGKIKDAGLIRLVQGGFAVYNAKSDEILLLPFGMLALRRSLGKLLTLFVKAGVQPTACFGAGPFSIADRFVRAFGKVARAFLEEREGNLVFTGYGETFIGTQSFVRMLGEVVREEPVFADLGCCILEEWRGDTWRLSLGVPADKEARESAPGICCSACGWGGLPESVASARETVSEKSVPGYRELPVKEVYTPGASTIAELCRQLDVSPSRTLKTMCYSTGVGENVRVVAALVRGDMAISLEKLRRVLGASEVRRSTPEDLARCVAGVAGYLGPIGLGEAVTLVADSHIVGACDLVVGANKPDFHLTGACWGRDFSAPLVADLVRFEKDSPCPLCGEPLSEVNWRVLGYFDVPASASAETALTYRDQAGAHAFPFVWTGCVFGISLLSALAEQGGEKWPEGYAPFDAWIVPVLPEDNETAERLLQELSQQGLAPLLDDRECDAEKKMADAHLAGVPALYLVDTTTSGKHLLTDA
jgi:prolyl-tRNA synthetase